MDVYFLLVSDSMSLNAKFPVMFIGWIFEGIKIRIYDKSYIYIYIYIYIKEIIKKRTKRIFHNILVLTFSLLLQIFRYNVYKCIYMTLTIV